MTAVVEATRGPLVESRHRVHVAVVHAERGLIASAGDAHYVSFVRSAIKMFQALPLAEDGVIKAFALTPQEVALCTASHNAEPFHVETAQEILRKAGVDETSLACGPHAPMFEPAARDLEARGARPGPIHNNCSGKHAGMLALAQYHGWPTHGYQRLDHPVQARVQHTLARWCELRTQDLVTAVDGCGLPTFAAPLANVAGACARFADAAANDGPARQIASAMMRHPEYVAGTDRLCTAVMAASGGRLFVKVGAEGFYCAGIPERRLGIALKVEDGALRASEPALLAVLGAVDALSGVQLDTLSAFARPRVVNTLGAEVGEIRARIDLRHA